MVLKLVNELLMIINEWQYTSNLESYPEIFYITIFTRPKVQVRPFYF